MTLVTVYGPGLSWAREAWGMVGTARVSQAPLSASYGPWGLVTHWKKTGNLDTSRATSIRIMGPDPSTGLYQTRAIKSISPGQSQASFYVGRRPVFAWWKGTSGMGQYVSGLGQTLSEGHVPYAPSIPGNTHYWKEYLPGLTTGQLTTFPRVAMGGLGAGIYTGERCTNYGYAVERRCRLRGGWNCDREGRIASERCYLGKGRIIGLGPWSWQQRTSVEGLGQVHLLGFTIPPWAAYAGGAVIAYWLWNNRKKLGLKTNPRRRRRNSRQRLREGDRIECTTGPKEDWDTGTVIDVQGDAVTVAWDSEIQTTQPAKALAGCRKLRR